MGAGVGEELRANYCSTLSDLSQEKVLEEGNEKWRRVVQTCGQKWMRGGRFEIPVSPEAPPLVEKHLPPLPLLSPPLLLSPSLPPPFPLHFSALPSPREENQLFFATKAFPHLLLGKLSRTCCQFSSLWPEKS